MLKIDSACNNWQDASKVKFYNAKKKKMKFFEIIISSEEISFHLVVSCFIDSFVECFVKSRCFQFLKAFWPFLFYLFIFYFLISLFQFIASKMEHTIVHEREKIQEQDNTTKSFYSCNRMKL